MKLLPMKMLNPSKPEFAQEVARQAALLRNAPEECDALDFIDAAAAEVVEDIQYNCGQIKN